MTSLMLKQFLKNMYSVLSNSYLHLAYPSQCLHCRNLLSPSSLALCADCAYQLELVNPEERCPTCFNVFSDPLFYRCDLCVQYPSLGYKGNAAAFDYAGPAATLVRCLKYADQPHLALGMGAFLVAQWEQLGWPWPDALIPVPIAFSHWLCRGYNQSELLAEAMGQYLGRPVWRALKRKSGDYSQAALSLEQRRALDSLQFHLRSRYPLEGKTLLIIDDVQTSGATLQGCAEAIRQGYPSACYALTFCRSIT